MSSSRRKFVVRHSVAVDIGCVCRRSKLFSLFSTLAKPTGPKSPEPISPSTATSTSHQGTSLATTSLYGGMSSPSQVYSAAESPRRRRSDGNDQEKKKWAAEEGEAVVVESSDPYLDFRDSMVLMIVEMEIYTWEDLHLLLHRFLSLNSPYHHHLILRAFVEIWNGIFSPATTTTTTTTTIAACRTNRR